MRREDWERREEGALVVLARHGDLSAFDALVARYRPAVLVLAKQIVRPVELAEDAVQDSFLAAFKALPNLKDPGSFAGWLGAIVRHRCRKLARGERTVHLTIDDVILCHAPSLSEHIERRIGVEAVRCALRGLQDDLRLVLELYYLEDWSVRQIGDFLGLPDTTVKWRLHAGRKLMRPQLQILEEINESGNRCGSLS